MTEDTPYAPVRQADVADRQAVSDILTEAFMDDPVACWLFPGSDERGRLQSHFYGRLLDQGSAEAYLVGRGEGASVWLALASGQAPDEERPDAPDVDQNSIFGENAHGCGLSGRHWPSGIPVVNHTSTSRAWGWWAGGRAPDLARRCCATGWSERTPTGSPRTWRRVHPEAAPSTCGTASRTSANRFA
jgi:hypothetical protein